MMAERAATSIKARICTTADASFSRDWSSRATTAKRCLNRRSLEGVGVVEQAVDTGVAESAERAEPVGQGEPEAAGAALEGQAELEERVREVVREAPEVPAARAQAQVVPAAAVERRPQLRHTPAITTTP